MTPDQRYTEGEECPEELVINFTVAQWSSNTVRDCITMFGARRLGRKRPAIRN